MKYKSPCSDAISLVTIFLQGRGEHVSLAPGSTNDYQIIPMFGCYSIKTSLYLGPVCGGVGGIQGNVQLPDQFYHRVAVTLDI